MSCTAPQSVLKLTIALMTQGSALADSVDSVLLQAEFVVMNCPELGLFGSGSVWGKFMSTVGNNRKLDPTININAAPASEASFHAALQTAGTLAATMNNLSGKRFPCTILLQNLLVLDSRVSHDCSSKTSPVEGKQFQFKAPPVIPPSHTLLISLLYFGQI